MKSVIQASWLLTVAFGNLIVVFITEFIKFDSQVYMKYEKISIYMIYFKGSNIYNNVFQAKEFFLFSGLMFIDMIIFAIMAYFYKPANISSSGIDEDEGKMSSNMPMQSANVFENSGYEKET
jgi:solute carrier family 15 oligopeptide transporter 1